MLGGGGSNWEEGFEGEAGFGVGGGLDEPGRGGHS